MTSKHPRTIARALRTLLATVKTVRVKVKVKAEKTKSRTIAAAQALVLVVVWVTPTLSMTIVVGVRPLVKMLLQASKSLKSV